MRLTVPTNGGEVVRRTALSGLEFSRQKKEVIPYVQETKTEVVSQTLEVELPSSGASDLLETFWVSQILD